MVENQYPAVRMAALGSVLSIDIRLDETRTLTDLYTRTPGLDLFRDGAFHVLLSAFWQRHDPRFVTQQTLKCANETRRLFVGRYLREVDTGERPPVPYDLFGTVETFLRDLRLTDSYHWLSTVGTVDEDGTFADIRLDGVRQPDLEATINQLDWIYDGRDYRLRNAIAILKA